jgi:hypothetical protein
MRFRINDCQHLNWFVVLYKCYPVSWAWGLFVSCLETQRAPEWACVGRPPQGQILLPHCPRLPAGTHMLGSVLTAPLRPILYSFTFLCHTCTCSTLSSASNQHLISGLWIRINSIRIQKISSIRIRIRIRIHKVIESGSGYGSGSTTVLKKTNFFKD